jgi:hypothetical protein
MMPAESACKATPAIGRSRRKFRQAVAELETKYRAELALQQASQ